eukprot:5357528-Pyramimonas_sp.AAC.1
MLCTYRSLHKNRKYSTAVSNGKQSGDSSDTDLRALQQEASQRLVAVESAVVCPDLHHLALLW